MPLSSERLFKQSEKQYLQTTSPKTRSPALDENKEVDSFQFTALQQMGTPPISEEVAMANEEAANGVKMSQNSKQTEKQEAFDYELSDVEDDEKVERNTKAEKATSMEDDQKEMVQQFKRMSKGMLAYKSMKMLEVRVEMNLKPEQFGLPFYMKLHCNLWVIICSLFFPIR